MGSLVEVTSVWLEQIKNLGFELLCYVTLVVELSSSFDVEIPNGDVTSARHTNTHNQLVAFRLLNNGLLRFRYVHPRRTTLRSPGREVFVSISGIIVVWFFAIDDHVLHTW